MGCSANWEEGASLTESQDLRSEGKPFARGSPVHVRSSSSPRPSSAQPSVGIPVPLRKRSWEEAMNFDTPLPDGLAPPGKRCRWGGVARSPPSLDREGYHASLVCPRGSAGEARATQRRGWKHPPADAREDRTLEVVPARRRMSLQKSTADVLAQRSGRLHFNRFGGVRGRAPSPYRPRASANDRGQRDIGTGSTRKQSRDRARDRPYPHGRGQAGDGRHLRPPKWAALHGAPADAVLAASWATHSRE